MSERIDVLAVPNLSDSQVAILEMLNPEWDGAIDGPTANVLRSLERRGFACHTEWPRKCWSITEEGRAALARIAPNELHDKAAELRGRGE